MGSVTVQYCDRCKSHSESLKAYRWGKVSQVTSRHDSPHDTRDLSREVELCAACIYSADIVFLEFLGVVSVRGRGCHAENAYRMADKMIQQSKDAVEECRPHGGFR